MVSLLAGSTAASHSLLWFAIAGAIAGLLGFSSPRGRSTASRLHIFYPSSNAGTSRLRWRAPDTVEAYVH